MFSVAEIIEKFELKQHPEGGFFRESYRSDIEISFENLPPGYSGKRNLSTCIYFLLTSDTFSAFHRIKQDEIWHFYTGSSIHLHTLSDDGTHKEHIIGNDISAGEIPQLIVAGGDWFGARVEDDDTYALVGCTVSPGFDFDDFELTPRNELIGKFPQHTDIIRELTRQ